MTILPLFEFAEVFVHSCLSVFNHTFPLGYELLLLLLCLSYLLVPVAGADDDVYRFDPAKRIPLLTEQNWSEWSWRIAAAFAAMGVATNVLWSSQQSADVTVPQSVYDTAEITNVQADLNAARQQKRLANEGTTEYKQAVDKISDLTSDMTAKKAAAKAAYIANLSDDPFNSIKGKDKVRTSCFQLIVRTVSPELGFLVMNYTAANLSECWCQIRDYFQVNTRGVRNQLKVSFYTMVMEPKQKLAEFKNKIIFAAKQLNCMTPNKIITDDDQTTVLMTGVRKHHAEVFRTTLDVLEQSVDEVSFEDTYKRMIPAARRAETADVPAVERGLIGREEKKNNGSFNQRNQPCRDFARGKCRFGSKCKFSHPSNAKDPNNKCGYCGKTGHTEKTCFKKRNDGKEKKDVKALVARMESLEAKLKKKRSAKEKAKVAVDSDYETASDGESAFLAASKDGEYSTFFLVALFMSLFSFFRFMLSFLVNSFIGGHLKGGLSERSRNSVKFFKNHKFQPVRFKHGLRPMSAFEKFVSQNSGGQHGVGRTRPSSSHRSTAFAQRKRPLYKPRNKYFKRSKSVASASPPPAYVSGVVRNYTAKKSTKFRSKNAFVSPGPHKAGGNSYSSKNRNPRVGGDTSFTEKWSKAEFAYFSYADALGSPFRQSVAMTAVSSYLCILSLLLSVPRDQYMLFYLHVGCFVMSLSSFFYFLFQMRCCLYNESCMVAGGSGISALDSGATSHYFDSLDKFVPSTIKKCHVPITIAGGKKIFATHKGTIKLPVQLPNGMIVVRHLRDSFYVPGLEHNLISLRRLDELGHRMVSENGTMKVFTGSGKVFLHGSIVNGLYRLSTPAVPPQIASLADNTGSLPDVDLWHRRLGHAAGIYLKNLVSGKQQLSYCDACVKAKSHRRPVRQVNGLKSVAKCPLQIVVSDLCGPMRTQSLSGKYYLATIIDVATRFIFSFFIRYKSDFTAVLSSWLEFIKRQTGKVPKRFHADGGTEYVNKDTTALFEKHGVKFTTTAPYSPFQNAIAERANRSLFESARAMMIQAGAPKNLWAEAVKYAAYIRNRTPHKGLDMQLPFDLFPPLSGRRHTDVHRHTRIWGCRAWLHIGKKKAGKLSARAVECVFLGVDSMKQGYRLYRLDNSSICISRNVVFDESVFPWLDAHGGTVPQPAGDAYVPVEVVGADDDSESSAPKSAWQRESQPAAPATSTRSLRRNPEPSAQALRNIAGDAADVAVSDDEMPDLVSSSDDDSDDDSLPDLASDTSSDESDDGHDDITPSVYFARSNRAARFNRPRFKRKKSKSHDPDEPSTRKKMLQLPKSVRDKWFGAEHEEMDSIKKRKTWIEVPEEEAKQAGREPLGNKWVYKIKRNVDHSVERYKARLTVQGFKQIYGLDYEEVFSAVAQLKSFRLLLALSLVFNWKVTQVDIKCAFLHGDLKETVYMKHPDGYPGTPGTVLKLVKALYGLKQSGRVFSEKLFSVLSKIGFRKNGADTCVLFHSTWLVFMCVVVDDLAIFTANEEARKKVMSALRAEFDVKDLGTLSRYVNIQVERGKGKIFVHQRAHVEGVIKKFGMVECKPSPTPAVPSAELTKKQCPVSKDEKKEMAEVPYRQMVGSLWYAANGTRPDIVYATNVVSKYGNNPGVSHFKAVKRILRYLRGSLSRGITYTVSNNVDIVAYSDSDWAADTDTRRSRTGYVILISGGPVIWQTKSQKTVALSSCEAELYALCDCVKELLWLIQFLKDMNISFTQPILYVDNQGAIALAKNPVNHQRSKHIDIKIIFY